MNKIQIIEWASIIGTILTCFIFLMSKIERLEDRLDVQGARTDRLYEMFVELRRDSDQKFYDLLKEQRK